MKRKSPDIAKILKRIPNRFLLAIAVAKRARQLKDGAKPLVDIDREELLPVLTALEEIENDKISVTIKDEIDLDADLMEEINQNLDEDIIEAEPQEIEDKKTKKEIKSRSKSKSLGA